jgi:predicted MPP superfamily phosphohydrolase
MLYAVGDIHGEVGKLDALLEKLPLEAGDRLVFLGDYVDRGLDSHAVVERLIALRKSYQCVFLLGNHESMFLDFLGWRNPAYFGGEAFLMNGGDRTLASYNYLQLLRERGFRQAFRAAPGSPAVLPGSRAPSPGRRLSLRPCRAGTR